LILDDHNRAFAGVFGLQRVELTAEGLPREAIEAQVQRGANAGISHRHFSLFQQQIHKMRRFKDAGALSQPQRLMQGALEFIYGQPTHPLMRVRIHSWRRRAAAKCARGFNRAGDCGNPASNAHSAVLRSRSGLAK
jgi:hypothetical protein